MEVPCVIYSLPGCTAGVAHQPVELSEKLVTKPCVRTSASLPDRLSIVLCLESYYAQIAPEAPYRSGPWLYALHAGYMVHVRFSPKKIDHVADMTRPYLRYISKAPSNLSEFEPYSRFDHISVMECTYLFCCLDQSALFECFLFDIPYFMHENNIPKYSKERAMSSLMNVRGARQFVLIMNTHC